MRFYFIHIYILLITATNTCEACIRDTADNKLKHGLLCIYTFCKHNIVQALVMSKLNVYFCVFSLISPFINLPDLCQSFVLR